MSARLVPALILLVASLPAADFITVTAPAEDSVRLPSGADPGGGLRLLPGVEAVRMGGIGLDPVVRGQQGSRLLVLADGACPHGGCPNRMDPPTSYAPADANRAMVEAGGLSVRHPGAPMGVVRLDREPPRLGDGRWQAAEAEVRGASNGHAAEAGAALALGDEQAQIQGRFHSARADDYEDGDGNAVRSGFHSSKGGGTLAWTPDAQTRLELSHDLTRERDVLFAGAGMDAPSSDDRTTRLRFSHRRTDGLLATANLDAYASRVEHLMDNYSLRPVAGMAMRAPSTSNTTGARTTAELRTAAGLLGLGLDGEELHQDARRYAGASPASVTTLNSLLWPDVRQRRFGAWGDLAVDLGSDTRLVPGLRWDVVRSSADEAGVDPPGMPLSPAALYALYYGSEAEPRTEHLLGAALRLEHDWGDSGRVVTALSRQQRAADPTERFIAANGSSPSQRWVGDPGLTAETHWQAQVAIEHGDRETVRWRAEAWADRVQDYIRRDRARAQADVLVADGATIYHGTDALLAGTRIEAGAPLAAWLRAEVDAAWTWGEDLATGLPLAQIPPLSGRAALRCGDDHLSGTIAVRWSARAVRLDDDVTTGSGLDAGETPTWTVLDLTTAWRPYADVELSAGVDNLLDRTYAEHLNKPNAFDPTVTQVNEPGRSLWLAASMRF